MYLLWKLLGRIVDWCVQTRGLSLEEINALFGDEVVVHFADATEKQRHELAAKVLAEDEQREFASRRDGNESTTLAPKTQTQ